MDLYAATVVVSVDISGVMVLINVATSVMKSLAVCLSILFVIMLHAVTYTTAVTLCIVSHSVFV